MIAGKHEIREIAIMSPYWRASAASVKADMMLESPTGRVMDEELKVTTRGQKKLFQEDTKVRIVITEIAGMERGNTILQRMVQ